MKNCKYCQAELAEDSTLCPVCGKDNAETEIPAEEAAPVTEETVAPETAPAEETAPVEEAAPEVKKATPGKIALAVAAVIVLVAALVALIVVGLKDDQAEDSAAVVETTAAAAVEETVAATVPADGNPDDATCKGTYTVTDEEALANKETIVATIGDQTLTNGELQVYYWSMVNNYLSSDYGYTMMMYGLLDYTQPLDTQMSYENQSMTWQQYFLQEALNYWQLSQSLANRAQENGMEMSSEDREYLDSLKTSLEQTAASYGMSLKELLLNNVGPGAGLEEFTSFQELYCRGNAYYSAEIAKIVPTEEDLEAYFAAHEEELASSGVTKDSKSVDVRHILISVEGGTTDEEGNTTYTDEEWKNCQDEAQAILDTWLAGDKTEESFAALANEKSEDPGSNTNGGLYEQVTEGMMVPAFNDWCFDASRQYGDYDLVQTDYGYHVMFFVGSEPLWKTYAESGWVTEQTNDLIAGVVESYPMEVSYDKISLGYIDMAA